MSESITLKWGTVKGWSNLSKQSQELMKKYMEGASWSAMQDHPDPKRISILLEIIDQLDGEIWNDWEGCLMTKNEAKDYIKDYHS